MEIVLIRHGKTGGNLKGRYIGITDEPLCGEGRRALKSRRYPAVGQVVTSGMLRCIETAGLIYPNIEPLICTELNECDFGLFENRNYEELKGNPDYQAWIDSEGRIPFPGGESHERFCVRCRQGFDSCVEMMLNQESIPKCAAFVVHGGTIMAVLEAFAEPHQPFYSWQVKNGCGYIAELSETDWLSGKKQLQVKEKLI